MKAVTPRKQFLLAEVKAGRLSSNGACLGATRQYRIDREAVRYPRVQRQPTSAEMETLRADGYIAVRRMVVTITKAGRKALRRVGG